MIAPSFTVVYECWRCGGFPRAFALSPIACGKCLRCAGSLRTIRTYPMRDLSDHRGSRASHIATIAACLAAVGAPAPRNARGEKESPFGFTVWRKNDTVMVFAATLTTCDPDVRARGYAAFARVCRERIPERAEKVLACVDRLLARYTGLPLASVEAWATDTTPAALAA